MLLGEVDARNVRMSFGGGAAAAERGSSAKIYVKMSAVCKLSATLFPSSFPMCTFVSFPYSLSLPFVISFCVGGASLRVFIFERRSRSASRGGEKVCICTRSRPPRRRRRRQRHSRLCFQWQAYFSLLYGASSRGLLHAEVVDPFQALFGRATKGRSNSFQWK